MEFFVTGGLRLLAPDSNGRPAGRMRANVTFIEDLSIEHLLFLIGQDLWESAGRQKAPSKF
jgi:hypothetical protein